MWGLILPGIALFIVIVTVAGWRWVMRDESGPVGPAGGAQAGDDTRGRRSVWGSLGGLIAALTIGCIVLYLAILAWATAG